MKRISVMLPDVLALRLRCEARRRGVSAAEVVREAVERHLPSAGAARPLAFFALGDGGASDTSERVDEYVQRAVRKRAQSR